MRTKTLGAASALLVLAGCGVEATSALLSCPAGFVSRNGSCAPVTEPEGRLRIEPAVLTFGTIPTGDRALRELRVINESDQDLELLVRSVPDGFNGITGAILVRAGTTLGYAVEFLPRRPGIFDAALLVDICDGECPREIRLVGEATEGGSAVECSRVDFGTFPVGLCAEFQMSCTNQGATDVRLARAEIVPAEPDFFLSFPPAGVVVRPGRTANFPVSFCPTRPEPYAAEVVFVAEGVAIPPRGQLTGQGQAEQCQLDVSPFLDFGEIPRGETAVRDLFIGNFGFTNCRIQVEGFDPASSREFEVETGPFDVQPGAGVSIPVVFRGGPAGNYQGRLFVVDEVGLPYEIQVSAIVVGPTTSLTVTSRMAGRPPTLRFGEPLTWQQGSDDGFQVLEIPFPFTLFGQTQRQVWVSTNGFISFSGQEPWSLANTFLPDRQQPNQLIAWWWDDLNPGNVSPENVRWSVDRDSIGRAVLTIDFREIPLFGTPNSAFTAQLRLYEADNRVEVHYGLGSDEPQSRATASAGWENAFGTAGQDILMCSPNCDAFFYPTNVIYTYRDAP